MKNWILVPLTLLVSMAAFADASGDVCLTMANAGYQSKAQTCVSVVKDGTFQNDAAGVCSVIANAGYYDNATTCLQSVKNNYFQGSLIEQCMVIANAGYHQKAIGCLDAVANKTAVDVVVKTCGISISTGYYDKGIECMNANTAAYKKPTVVVPNYGGGYTNGQVTINKAMMLNQLNEARNQLAAGNVRNADLLLQTAIALLNK
jgi:hypothetical protein